MTDIVERLRRLPPSPIAFGDSEADKRNRAERNEAADEIERLREQKRFCVLQISDGYFCVGDVEIGLVLGVYKIKRFAKRRAEKLNARQRNRA